MSRPRQTWLITFLLASLPLLGWWAYGLFDLDEGFYGAIVSEMNRRGEWITPYYNGEPWFEKPILLYWIAKPCLTVFGTDWGPRLPSILATLATYLLVAWFARRHFGRAVAQRSVLILGTSFLFIVISRMMMTDPLHVLTLTAALMTFWESLVGNSKWRLLTAACLGLSTLAKGPVGLAVFILIASLTYWKQPSLRPRFRGQWGLGTLILFAVIASWYLPAYAANGSKFVDEFLIQQNLNRFAGEDIAHAVNFSTGLIFFPVVILFGMLPWSLWLIPVWRTRTESIQQFLWTCALSFLAFYMLSGSKLPHYIHIVYPFFAILTADYLVKRQSLLRTEFLPRRMMIGYGISLTVLLAFIQTLTIYYYQASGHREIHALARFLAPSSNRVATYQLPALPDVPRQPLASGLKLNETSHPSILLYLNHTVRARERLTGLIRLPNGTWVLTRKGRISAEDEKKLAAMNRWLEPVQTPMRQDDFRLYRILHDPPTNSE